MFIYLDYLFVDNDIYIIVCTVYLLCTYIYDCLTFSRILMYPGINFSCGNDLPLTQGKRSLDNLGIYRLRWFPG